MTSRIEVGKGLFGVLGWDVERGMVVVAMVVGIEGLICPAGPESIALAGAVGGVEAAERRKHQEGMREGRRKVVGGMENQIGGDWREEDVGLDHWPSSEACLHLGQRETQREDQKALSSCVAVVAVVVEGADREGEGDMRQDLFVQVGIEVEVEVEVEVEDKMDGKRWRSEASCGLDVVDEDQTQRKQWRPLDRLWHHLRQEEWKAQEEKVVGLWVEC